MIVERIRAGYRSSGPGGQDGQWRRRIRREVLWLLVLKFVALTLLWYLFFGPAHRQAVDGDVTSRQLGIADGAGDRSTIPGPTLSGRALARGERL